MLKKAKEKIKKARKLNKELYNDAKEGIKIKIQEYKTDPKLIALVTVDVILILLIVFALMFLFDPNMDFLDTLSKALGINYVSDPMPWEAKLALFLITLVAAWKLYSYTEWYRKKINRK